MSSPFEMVSGPLTVYYADEGTSAPELATDPGAGWTLLGTNGSKSLTDDGVSVTFEETIESQRVLGSTGVQKVFRTEEDMMISMSLVDLTSEAFAIAMGGLDITDVAAGAGTAGYRQVELLRGFDVLNKAFLARGYSPYADNMNAQFWLPKGYASFSGALEYVKGQATEIALEIMAIEHTTHKYGQYQAQDALAG